LDLDQLVEKLRRGGVLDQPWQLLTPEGDRVAFCGSSIFALLLSARKGSASWTSPGDG